MNNVLICHPGLQHSHQFALALHEANLLGWYFSGVPVKANDREWSWLPNAIHSKIKTVNIPASLRQHPIYWQLLLRIGNKFGGAGYQHDFSHKVFHWFDAQMAKEVVRLKPDVVVCFENSAAMTFAAAKKIGAKCILDAPSIHYKAGETLINYTSNGYLSEIKKRKDTELLLADAIITCSSYGAKTYIDAGISTNKMHPVLLGAELPKGIVNTRSVDKYSFVFAGSMSERKSIDLILSVFERLVEESIPVELVIVGGTESIDWITCVERIANVKYVGAVSQRKLYDFIAASDCLLLPSRFDSFGMVVAEAMAVGVPAIVSTNTGAKEMIEQFPGSGWVIDATEQDIYDSIKKVINGEWDVKEAGEKALDAAKYFTWESYRKRVVDILKDVMDD